MGADDGSMAELEEEEYGVPWHLYPGIIVGWLLFVAFMGIVINANFGRWVMNPNRKPPPTPETYLHACIHAFVAMVVTGAILTFSFSEMASAEAREHTALIEWFGYNNVCIVFDTPPSTYVCPMYWFVVGYLAVRFAVEDTEQRVMPMKHVSNMHKRLAGAANALFALVCTFFSLCLAIRPEDDMITHASPFAALVLSLAVIYIFQYYQHDGKRKTSYTIAILLYTAISILKASFTIVALATEGEWSVSATIAKPVDIVWVAAAAFAPFYFHPPSATRELLSVRLAEVCEQYRRSRLRTYTCRHDTVIRSGCSVDSRLVGKVPLKKGERVLAEEIVGNQLRFHRGVGHASGWVSIKHDGVQHLDAATSYRCLVPARIRAEPDWESKRIGKLQPGEIFEGYSLETNMKEKPSAEATGREYLQISKGWVAIHCVSGAVAVEPTRSFECLVTSPIRAGLRDEDDQPIGELRKGKLVHALQVKSGRGQTSVRVTCPDSNRSGWVTMRRGRGKGPPTLREVASRVPTNVTKQLAKEMQTLQDEYDNLAGMSWSLQRAREVDEISASGRFLEALTAPLGLLLALWALTALLTQLLYATVKNGLLRCFDCSFAGRGVGHGDDNAHTIPNFLSITKGTILGYMRYLGGWTRFLVPLQEEMGGTVFAEDIGCPVLMLLDAKSASRAILEGTDVEQDAHGHNVRFVRDLFAGQAPNFERSGDLAKRARQFFLEMMPKDAEDPRFVEAVKAMGCELRHWARMSNGDLRDIELVEAMGGVIISFASHLFLGRTLDPSLVEHIFPMPGCLPAHPKFVPGKEDAFPKRMLPAFHKGVSTSKHLFALMRESPNWTVYTAERDTEILSSSSLDSEPAGWLRKGDQVRFEEARMSDGSKPPPGHPGDVIRFTGVILADSDGAAARAEDDIAHHNLEDAKAALEAAKAALEPAKAAKLAAQRAVDRYVSPGGEDQEFARLVALRQEASSGLIAAESRVKEIQKNVDILQHDEDSAHDRALEQQERVLRMAANDDLEYGWVRVKHLRAPVIKQALWSQRQSDTDAQLLTDEEACGNMLVAMTFNAAGLSNSLLLPFVVLPPLIRAAESRNTAFELNDDILGSMAWEFLRHNGPPVKRKLRKPCTVETSRGCPAINHYGEGEWTETTRDDSAATADDHTWTKATHQIPAGTTCFTHLGMIQRDASLWDNPHSFRADRFLRANVDALQDVEAPMEQTLPFDPLPVLGMGYPLGTDLNDRSEDSCVTRSHGCVFASLAQPLVKAFITRLLADFTFVLDREPELQVSDDGNEVFLPPSLLKGGMKASEDMLPVVKDGLAFASFAFKNEDAEERYTLEYNSLYPKFEFATDAGKREFAREYIARNPSHMVVPDGMDLEPDPDSTIHEVRDDAGNLHRLGSVRLRHRVVRDAEPEVQSAPQTSREDRARLQAALESGEHEGEDRERILGRLVRMQVAEAKGKRIRLERREIAPEELRAEQEVLVSTRVHAANPMLNPAFVQSDEEDDVDRSSTDEEED